MDGMNAPPHQILSSPPQAGSAGILHLYLHQIKKAGLRAGISDGGFAKMLNELELDEEQMLLLKKRDELARMMELSKLSFELGQDIIRLQSDIHESLRTIDKKMAELSDEDPQLARLRDDRNELSRAHDELDRIDEERRDSNNLEDLARARTRFTNLERDIADPLERHEQDTPFNFEADRRRRQPRSSTPDFDDEDDTPEPKPDPNGEA